MVSYSPKLYTAGVEWWNLLKCIINHGSDVHPRAMNCRELLAHQTRVDMRFPVVNHFGRDMGYRFMCAEAAWILSGDDRVKTIAPYSKMISRFSDDGIRFSGAYGPKVMSQVRYVVDTLKSDRFSRQAIINIWRENPRPSKDIPCTLSLQFLLRGYEGSRLNCVATMRSSDAWLGWVYDVFNFSMISAYIILCLRDAHPMYREPPTLGNLYLTAGSQHIYESNMPAANRCIGTSSYWQYDPIDLSEFNDPEALVNHLVALSNHEFDNLGSSFLKELRDVKKEESAG